MIKYCKWKWNNDTWQYDTGCGKNEWALDNLSNEYVRIFKFCPFCGKEIRI